MSTNTFILLSVLEAVLLVVVLAIALIRIRQHLDGLTASLGALGGALGGIEKDLQLIGVAVPPINDPLAAIAGALPGIAHKAEQVNRRAKFGAR